LLLCFWLIATRSHNTDKRFIHHQLREAKKSNARIKKFLHKFSMRKIWKAVRKIHQANTKLLKIIQQFPERYGRADKFFSLYLKGLLETLGRYETLAKNSLGNENVQGSGRKPTKPCP